MGAKSAGEKAPAVKCFRIKILEAMTQYSWSESNIT
jgi:hypothetical protein